MINATLGGSPSGIKFSGSVSAYIVHFDLCNCEGLCVDPVCIHPVRAAEMISEHIENTTPAVHPVVAEHAAVV